MNTLVITQPTFLPWMGYFEQLAQADIVVWLDSVQFSRRSWQSRNRLKGPNGTPFWLTIPVDKHPRETLYQDIRINHTQGNWKKKQLASIQGALKKAPFFAQYFPDLEQCYMEETDRLVDFNIKLIHQICKWLGLRREFIRASNLKPEGSKADLILNICRIIEPTRYYTAMGAKDYMEPHIAEFNASGVEVEFQTWEHPVYEQIGTEFISHMAVIDAIMNVGAQKVGMYIGLDQSAGRS